jgi:hypothetical protein
MGCLSLHGQLGCARGATRTRAWKATGSDDQCRSASAPDGQCLRCRIAIAGGVPQTCLCSCVVAERRGVAVEVSLKIIRRGPTCTNEEAARAAVVRAKTVIEPCPSEAADFAASSLARDWGI